MYATNEEEPGCVADKFNKMNCKWNGPFSKGSPEDNLNCLIRQYKELDDAVREIARISQCSYMDLQRAIILVKSYFPREDAGDIDDANILSEIQEVISTTMEGKIVRSNEILRLTCNYRSKARLITRDAKLVIEPKYQPSNIERCFQTLLSLYKALVHKIHEKKRSNAKRQEYQREFSKKLSMVRCWVQRWRSSIADREADRFNLSVLTMRHKLYSSLELEAKEIMEEIQHIQILLRNLYDDPKVSEEDKCRGEDDFESLNEEIDALNDELQIASSDMLNLEGEARDLDSLYVEESTLLEHVESQLKEFYEYFNSRPVITSAKLAARVSKLARSALNKLSAVAEEIDALNSIEEIKANLGSKHKIPPNVYTSRTLKGAWEHYQNTLQCAGDMIHWAEHQIKVHSSLEKNGSLGNLENLLEDAALETRDLIAEIVQECSYHDKVVDKMSHHHRIVKIERVFGKLLTMREKKANQIVESAIPLHRHGQTTPGVLDLLNCWKHCIFTVLMLVDDALHQEKLLQLYSPTLEDVVKRKLLLNKSSLFFKSLGYRVLGMQENIKLNDNQNLVLLPADNPTAARDTDFNCNIESDSQLMDYCTKLDPYGRITCSGWLDMVYKTTHPDTRLPTLKMKRTELQHNFKLLCDDKPFITEPNLKRLCRNFPGLLAYCKKNISEYFGPENERYNKKGIMCYDYNRFIARLLGLRRKLSVNPN